MSDRVIQTPMISDPIGAQLSALLDGELPPDELRFLMRRIESDAELAQRWSRYQLARSVLRRQNGAPLRANFAEVLAQRVAAESVPARRRGTAVLRWVGGGAIAASVAVAALVMTRPALQGPSAAAVTAAVTPAAIQDTRTPASSPQMPASLSFFDYAQPASFETSPYGMQPSELLRRRYEPIETGRDGVPYVQGTPLLPERKAESPQQ